MSLGEENEAFLKRQVRNDKMARFIQKNVKNNHEDKEDKFYFFTRQECRDQIIFENKRIIENLEVH